MMRDAAATITAHHRDRRAYVYVRQSTLKQVHQNQESQRNQYALVDRATALGWVRERVHVIDADLGQSGEDGTRRGFQELVAEVSLGRVGLILTYEVSRLARSNADWYTLLDLAAVVGTLIADTDGVYDPRGYNDRLLLGLRGMLSEAELHLLRLRLDAGRMRQVERGTYRQRLPTGLVRLADGRVVKDPDLGVQRTIALVFARFAQLGSCQQVLRSFRDEALRVPRVQTTAEELGRVQWKKASEAALYDILRNPAYAGAFVYGRHGPAPTRRPGQRPRLQRRPAEEWVVHRDVYPAYISWEDFVANQARLSDNAARHAERTRGAPRAGSALLAGLIVCGRCGRQLRVSYKPQPRYNCAAARKAYGEPMCLQLDGRSIDAAVVDAFFAALAPAELSLLDEVLAGQQAEHAQRAQQYTDQVRRAEYEARLAQRQYDAIDPDNRLVAAELERRWELTLRALAEAREAAERFAQAPAAPNLDPALRAQLLDLGPRLPELWRSGRLTAAQQKTLLRSLIQRVIVSRPVPDTVAITIVWVSGAHSPLTIQPPIHRACDVSRYDDLVARVVALGAEGYTDEAIAGQLTAAGFRAARRATIAPAWVGRLRRAQGQMALRQQFRRQAQVEGCWTVWGLARELGVERGWLYTRIKRGTLPVSRHARTGHYLIPEDTALFAQLRTEASECHHA